ncbi:DUF2141 domain-containing protein [Aquimarina algicola]|uniref:DUF2141 domain-containing protein n=1 Tax=Aquimarina algicola TaxID=2589995 RepID=A0A504JFA7_9FLAO|nr:DUF2141 domain-containing protein [Aquimarina algicola]TPN85200.1 DUF2141 domain-containing protein [Aquimarina algicola]
MKTLILFALLLISNLFGYAQKNIEKTTITVTVPNVTSSNGEVYFGLFDENTFMKSEPIQSEKSKIIDGVATVTFSNVPAGTYGISCYHDANDNKKMDFDQNGMPKEDYGVSNNNMSYGPPIWDDAKFEVKSENLNIEIRL